jgi:hypothetical protein
LAGPKLLVQFHPRASESKLATAALGTAYSMELGNEWNVDSAGADLNLASELIDIAPTASPKPMVAAFGQTAQRLPGLGAPKSSKGRRAHQRRQHRNIGSKLCDSLRYEMPSLSFDSSRVRSNIQTLGGLMIDGPKKKITMAGTHPLKTQSIQRTAFMIRAFWNDTPIEYIDRLVIAHCSPGWVTGAPLRSGRPIACVHHESFDELFIESCTSIHR